MISSDIAILDLLRKQDSLSVSQLSSSMQVTATAVRQRLTRLLGQGLIDRVAIKSGRGRPSFRYILTNQGRRKTGENFADLAIALWREIRQIKDPEIQRGLLQRLAKRLAATYGPELKGTTLEDKMASLAELFAARRLPFEVENRRGLPVLTALACPYPDLAEIDRSICSMERILFSELLGQQVRLSQCRLDGDGCCSFEAPPRGTS